MRQKRMDSFELREREQTLSTIGSPQHLKKKAKVERIYLKPFFLALSRLPEAFLSLLSPSRAFSYLNLPHFYSNLIRFPLFLPLPSLAIPVQLPEEVRLEQEGELGDANEMIV